MADDTEAPIDDETQECIDAATDVVLAVNVVVTRLAKELKPTDSPVCFTISQVFPGEEMPEIGAAAEAVRGDADVVEARSKFKTECRTDSLDLTTGEPDVPDWFCETLRDQGLVNAVQALGTTLEDFAGELGIYAEDPKEGKDILDTLKADYCQPALPRPTPAPSADKPTIRRE